MPLQLCHHDLICVPRAGIYWLRVYRDDNGQGAVVVITEVPGNPGESVTNAISLIVGQVISQFGLSTHPTRWFEVYPRGFSGRPEARYKEVHLCAGQPSWTGSSRTAIEACIDGRLEDLPTHSLLYDRVKAKGGGNAKTSYRPVFVAMPVDELPAPHQPFRCAHYERFQHFDHQLNPESTREGALRAGQCFLSSLSAEDRRNCYYHGANWKAVADASVEILKQLGRKDPNKYIAWVDRSDLTHHEKRWLQSLFKDPVTLGESQYSDGQHRGCALRFSGADRAVVRVRDEFVGQVSSDWTYLGDG